MNPPILSLSPRPFPALLGQRALAALALASGALHAAQEVSVGVPNIASFSSSQTQATVGAVAAGDLDGNGNAELAAIRDDNLVIFPDAAVLDDGVVVIEDVYDATFCEPHDDQPPAFLVTSMRGLEIVTYEYPGMYAVGLVSSHALWQDAKVRSGAEVTGSGPSSFLLGLRKDGLALFHAQWSGASLGTPVDLHYSFNPAQVPVLDIALLNWDGDSLGKLEVGILHHAGIQVRPRVVAATPLMNRPGLSPGDSMAVLNDAGDDHDVLAWITHSSASSQVLLLFSPAFLSPPGITAPYLGPYGLPSLFSAVTGGDLDGDGDDDLLLSTLGASTATLLENHADGSWDPGVSPFSVDEDGAVTEEQSLDLSGSSVHGLIAADFFAQRNASGDIIDSLAVVDSGGDFVRVYPIVDSFGGVYLTPPSYDDFVRVTFHSERGTSCEESTTPNRWTIELDTGWGATPGVTHVEVIVRRSVNGTQVDNIAYHHSIHQVATSNTVDGTSVFFDAYSSMFEGANNWDEHKSDVYFVMVRPVIVSGPNVTQAWRWSILSMTGNCTRYSWMAGLYGASNCDVAVVPENVCESGSEWGCSCQPPQCNPQGQGSSYIPSAVPQSKIPGAGHILPIVYDWNY